jgi:hypothetical protein
MKESKKKKREKDRQKEKKEKKVYLNKPFTASMVSGVTAPNRNIKEKTSREMLTSTKVNEFPSRYHIFVADSKISTCIFLISDANRAVINQPCSTYYSFATTHFTCMTVLHSFVSSFFSLSLNNIQFKIIMICS